MKRENETPRLEAFSKVLSEQDRAAQNELTVACEPIGHYPQDAVHASGIPQRGILRVALGETQGAKSPTNHQTDPEGVGPFRVERN